MQKRRRSHRILWIVAGIGLLLAGPAAGDPPKRYRPLSAQEHAGAVAVARDRAEASAAARTRAATQGAGPPERTEVLLVERLHEKGGNPPRRADVYIYDYATDTLRRTVVDVASGAVHSEEVVQGVQLPLTQPELERALGIAYADAATRAVVEERYREVAGEVLQGIEQLGVKAFVFHADSKPDGLNDASRRCGIHRCAQLLFYTTDQVVIETQPIVDLSVGTVTQRLDF